MRGVATPPFDAMIRRSPLILRPRKASPKPPIYRPTFGPTKVAKAAVVNRSNSRNCGEISAEVVTKASGITSCTIALARNSCAGLR
jgi:hypothetical protein